MMEKTDFYYGGGGGEDGIGSLMSVLHHRHGDSTMNG